VRLLRIIPCAVAHDNAECSTAHRPHTNAFDPPDLRHRSIASSTIIGANAATPTVPNGSPVRNRTTDACDERVAGRH